MALAAVANGAVTDQLQLNQLINLLTGVMNDQPVTLKGDNTRAPQLLNLDSVNAAQQVGEYFRDAGTSKWGILKDTDNSFMVWDSLAQAVAMHFLAGTLNSGVSGGIVVPMIRAAGAPALGNALGTGRYIGQWTTAGAPTGLTAVIGDWGFDGNSNMWRCTTAGTPGTWQPVGRHFLGSTTLAVDGTPITVSGIPVGYSYLTIEALVRSAVAAAEDDIILRPNSDAGANYDSTRLWWAGAVANTANSSGDTKFVWIQCPGSTAPANAWGGGTGEIHEYASTAHDKFVQLRGGGPANATTYSAGVTDQQMTSGAWHPAVVAAVSSLTILSSAGNSLKAGSWLRVYGEA